MTFSVATAGDGWKPLLRLARACEFARLDQDEAEAVRLYAGGSTIGEIGRELERPYTQAKGLLGSALKQLRRTHQRRQRGFETELDFHRYVLVLVGNGKRNWNPPTPKFTPLGERAAGAPRAFGMVPEDLMVADRDFIRDLAGVH